MPRDKLRLYRVTYKSGLARTVAAYSPDDARKEATSGVYANAGPVSHVDSGSERDPSLKRYKVTMQTGSHFYVDARNEQEARGLARVMRKHSVEAGNDVDKVEAQS